MSLIQYQSFSITYNLYGIKYKSYNMTEWLMPGKTYKKQWEYSYNVHSKCKVVEMFQFHFLYAIALFCIDSSFCVLDSIRPHLEIAWNLVAHSERIFEKFYAINRLDGVANVFWKNSSVTSFSNSFAVIQNFLSKASW